MTFIETLLNTDEYKGLTEEQVVVGDLCVEDFFSLSEGFKCGIPDKVLEKNESHTEYCRKCWNKKCGKSVLYNGGSDITKEDVIRYYESEMERRNKKALSEADQEEQEETEDDTPLDKEIFGVFINSLDETAIACPHWKQGETLHANAFGGAVFHCAIHEQNFCDIKALMSHTAKCCDNPERCIYYTKSTETAETQPVVFDYSELDTETETLLRKCEETIREETSGYFTLLGAKFKEAQDLLASHGKGTFEKWYTSIGFKRQTVYNIIQRYEFASSPIIGGREDTFESLPLTLSYSISDPKAPAELVEKVLEGDIKTNAKYQELLKELEQQRKKATELEQKLETETERADRAENESKEQQKHAKGKNLMLENQLESAKADIGQLQDRIRELENSPAKTVVKPDETAIAEKDEEIDRLKKENASLRRHETKTVIIKATMDQVVEIMQLIEENFGRASELYQIVSNARPLKIE